MLSRVFTFVLINGGSGLLFWGFIGVCAGMLMVYASLAELSSMYDVLPRRDNHSIDFNPGRPRLAVSIIG